MDLVLRHQPGAVGRLIFRVWHGEERVGTILSETLGSRTFWV